MDGNKLKHRFVKKDQTIENWSNEWSNLVNSNTQPFIIERSFRDYEDIVISERISDEIMTLNNEGYMDYIKSQMVIKLSKLLLDEGFVDFTVYHNTYSNNTEFKMRIKAIRNTNNNVR